MPCVLSAFGSNASPRSRRQICVLPIRPFPSTSTFTSGRRSVRPPGRASVIGGFQAVRVRHLEIRPPRGMSVMRVLENELSSESSQTQSLGQVGDLGVGAVERLQRVKPGSGPRSLTWVWEQWSDCSALSPTAGPGRSPGCRSSRAIAAP